MSQPASHGVAHVPNAPQGINQNRAAIAALFLRSSFRSSMQTVLPIALFFATISATGIVVTGINGTPAEAAGKPVDNTGEALEELSIETSGQSPKTLKFQIEVARTPREKALGLMFRRELPPMRGMLFPHESEQPLSMWMKNTYIPLDMLFIKANGTIHRIEENTEPFSLRVISSQGNVSAVLEIAGGEARRLGIARGDKVRHPHFSTKD